MGIALADEFARRGAEVSLVLGPSSLKPSERVELIPVTTAEEMLAACQERIGTAHLAIFAAAVADYRPRYSSATKIKREGEDCLELELRYRRDPRRRQGALAVLHGLCPRE